MVRDLDICCLKNYYLLHATFLKVQTQKTKKFKPKKSRPKNQKLASSHNDTVELAKNKDKKDKKKRFWEQKQEQNKQTLATSVNVTKADSKKYLHIIYYNYNKKGHYSKFYPKLQKN